MEEQIGTASGLRILLPEKLVIYSLRGDNV
jgi:hypothetical protein